MSLLLDSHAFLWWLMDDDLDTEATRRISQSDERIFVSAASIWEITIKQQRHKLEVGGDLLVELESNGFEPLAISAVHARVAGELPLHHRDPFDRMLVAQAQVEGLTLVTRDRTLAAYEVDILPC